VAGSRAEVQADAALSRHFNGLLGKKGVKPGTDHCWPAADRGASLFAIAVPDLCPAEPLIFTSHQLR